MNTRISVITCVYNTDPILFKKAILSLYNQTFKDFEVLIINDGSDLYVEENKNIVNELNDSRFIWIDKEHAGKSQALNLALKQAKGKYIAINDADDISFKNRLEYQYEFLENNQEEYDSRIHFTNLEVVNQGTTTNDEFTLSIENFEVKVEDTLLFVEGQEYQIVFGLLTVDNNVIPFINEEDSKFVYKKGEDFILSLNKNIEIPVMIMGIPNQRIRDVFLKNFDLRYADGKDYFDFRFNIPEQEKEYPECNRFRNINAYGIFIRHAENVRLNDFKVKSREKTHRKFKKIIDKTSNITQKNVFFWKIK